MSAAFSGHESLLAGVQPNSVAIWSRHLRQGPPRYSNTLSHLAPWMAHELRFRFRLDAKMKVDIPAISICIHSDRAIFFPRRIRFAPRFVRPSYLPLLGMLGSILYACFIAR